MDIRLFHESGRRLIHKYRVYQDPLPHPALREGRITKLLSFVNRAMVIAQLTHLQIAIPSSGNPPGEVPSDCFPRMDEPGMTKTPKRVTFAPVIQTTTGEMDPPTMDQNETPTDSPMIAKQEETEEVRAHGIREESIVPPPGFRPFQWPQAEWEDIGDATLDPGLEFVASWSARIMEERSSPPPLIPLSPISAEDSQDYIMVQIGSPASELYTPAGLDRTRRRSRWNTAGTGLPPSSLHKDDHITIYSPEKDLRVTLSSSMIKIEHHPCVSFFLQGCHISWFIAEYIQGQHLL